jgi:hypothetical protein
MPSKSKAQHNLMAAAAHSPAFAKKVGIPMSVAKEFNQADKGMKFKGGGMAKEDSKMDMAQDKSMLKKAMKQHGDQLHGGKQTTLKLAKGGTASARADGCATKGKTKGTIISMCGGGMYKGK